jgi:hypothetical protein
MSWEMTAQTTSCDFVFKSFDAFFHFFYLHLFCQRLLVPLLLIGPPFFAMILFWGPPPC